MSSDTLEYCYGIAPEMLKSMNNNTKQSEETKIQWSMTGNPVLSGESTPEAILTIHPDGRVTTSDRLKPDETAALVLDQIKTQWLKDTQATKIRELQDRIKRLEEMYEGVIGEKPELLGSNVMGLLKRELNFAQNRIKRLEEAGDELVGSADAMEAWRKAKEDKP